MLHRIVRFCRDDNAAVMAEYGILVGMIAIVVAGAAVTLGQDISVMFSNIASFVAALPIAS